MNVLREYCDDGPLAERLRVWLPGSSLSGRLDWLIPVAIRAAEYGGVLAIAWSSDPAALPFAYAFLAAVAFHHYDIVYRIRHQRLAPPRWVARAGGGWELRLILVFALARAGHLRAGLAVAAVWLGLLFVTESVRSWVKATLHTVEQMSIEAGGD